MRTYSKTLKLALVILPVLRKADRQNQKGLVMIVRHYKQAYKKHQYRNLGWLVGEEVDVRIANLTQGGVPNRAVVINEYPDTILLELTFDHGKYRRMISKAQLYCGSIMIKHKESGRQITGSEVIISE